MLEEIFEDLLRFVFPKADRVFDMKRGFDAILSFLHNYVRFAKPETNRTFETEIDRLTGKINTMGIIEQVKQIKLAEAK